MPEKDELQYTAKDIPNILENMTENTETTGNAIPGTEVTQVPGLIPETPNAIPGYDPNTASPPQEFVSSTETGTTWDGTTVAPNTSGVGGAEADAQIGADDYAAAVDHQVDSMPPAYTASETAHQSLMQDPAYAVATHEHQLNKIADMLEELCARVVAIEDKLNQHDQDHLIAGTDSPITGYPEVTLHGGAPGLKP